jgi:hypothetical protein
MLFQAEHIDAAHIVAAYQPVYPQKMPVEFFAKPVTSLRLNGPMLYFRTVRKTPGIVIYR